MIELIQKVRNHAHIKAVYILYSAYSISKPIFIIHLTSLRGRERRKGNGSPGNVNHATTLILSNS